MIRCPNIDIDEDVLDVLPPDYPIPDQDSPTLATGQFALDRRSSSRRVSPLGRRVSRLDRRTYINSSGLNTYHGVSQPGFRNTFSSQGPDSVGFLVRKEPPPLRLLERRSRPLSELFLPTPVDPSKRVTVFKLPEVVDGKFYYDAKHDLPQDETLMTEWRGGEHGRVRGDEELDLEEPDVPPLSPLSAALSKARFSRLDVHKSVRHAIDNISFITENSVQADQRGSPRQPSVERRATAPIPLQRQLSTATLKTTRSLPERVSSIRTGGGSSRGASLTPMKRISMWTKRGTFFSGIDKDITAAKRASALSSKQRQSAFITPVSLTSPVTPLPSLGTASVLPWRRKRRGETMSMLLDSGFFPVNEFIYNPRSPKDPKSAISPTKKGRLALSILVNDIPSRPLSILGTPTELYQSGTPTSPRRHIRGSTKRRSFPHKRRVIGQLNSPIESPRDNILANAQLLSPLLPLSSPKTPSTPTSGLFKLNAELSPYDKSPGLLEVIHEDGDVLHGTTPPPVVLDDNGLVTEEPIDLPADTPVKTEIHLNSGTVLTVTPPELTSWKKNIYVQGPIRLLPSAVAPRKDSIASLDPFQDAMDRIYDQALLVPRRASEDLVMDDLLDWYDTWSFDYPSFAFDDFKENAETFSDRHFGTNNDGIDSPGPSPLEKAIAAHMLSAPNQSPQKLLNVLGVSSAEIAVPFANPTTSPTKSTFSFGTRLTSIVGGRKASLGTASGGHRKGSGYALETHAEAVTSPLLTTSHARRDSGFASSSTPPAPLSKDQASTMNATTATAASTGSTSATATMTANTITNTVAPVSTFEWDDDDDGPEKTSALPSWLIPSSHIEVKEIKAQRKGSPNVSNVGEESAAIAPEAEKQLEKENQKQRQEKTESALAKTQMKERDKAKEKEKTREKEKKEKEIEKEKKKKKKKWGDFEGSTVHYWC